MRILYLSESHLPYIGGVETLSDALLRVLRSRGHDVQVVTNQRRPDDRREDVVNGIPVRRFPMSWALAERRLDVVADIVHDLKAIKTAFDPDVVHVAHSGPSDFFHWRSGGAAPTLVTLHTPLAPGPMADHLRARAHRIVAVSPTMGEADVILNGSAEPSAPVVEPPREGAPVVLALGRIVFEKGFDLLLDAWPIVRGRLPGARLIVAGDGPERDRLTGEGVETPGWIAPENVFRVVDAANVVAVPSRWEEPFGLVALDAAWRARPVVAARRGGLVDIVDDGHTGLLVEPESKEALAAALLALLLDPRRARAMGLAARRRAAARYSLDRMCTDYEHAYAGLLRARPGPPR